ncbi:hypothetical protein CGGC5_v007048 [Colletotrichum fructicola Nara gc5]|uniref:Uncharacterized protein n=1 Tax=Colletotrichum fructicola (strain Nara gc5) TaxID=1213859 RepID=A0A7J6J4E3_COLFN|nr:hypothetical protein CGGC5_v007048 [Colletotrichum fructicola Nara gc5]
MKSKAEKWFRSLRDAVASKITTRRERPMLATEGEEFDAKCLIKGNGKAGAKLIGWNVELTRINVAMMKASQEFKSAVWLDLCRRHNTDRWVRKYFVWTWNIHDQDHVDRVYKSLIKSSGCSNVTVNSEWDTLRCLGDAERDHGRYITRAQLFPEIHFVEHDNEVEEQKYVGLSYSFPRRGSIPFYARNRSDNIEEPGEGGIRDERLLENTQYGDGQI